MMQNKRESAIELLKIGAILMIIISHVVQTLGSTELYIGSYPIDAFIDFSKSTTSIKIMFFQNLRYLGHLGNAVFFICSAWFLCDSKTVSLKKIVLMILDVWIISLIFVVIAKYIAIDVSIIIIIKSIFPTIFSNNWYVTFYILIYAMHPILNIVIEQLNRKALLSICLVSSILYFGMCFLKADLFFATNLITYIVLYFCIAYIKKYANKYKKNIRLNVKILLFACGANSGLIYLTNIFGLIGEQYVKDLGLQVLRWNSICNPFLIIIALCLFNIFRNIHFVDKTVNYVSSLSLLIYVIHENIIFRRYIRPLIFVEIFTRYGYDLIIIWVALIVLILFISSVILAILYQKTMHKITLMIANKICPKLILAFDEITEVLIKID